ncbi:hypothetical protein P692DRAFT_20644572, partial [Suillus brevipes Sb2]
SVDQTKAAFLGLTAHWIEANASGIWTLFSQVIAFRGISGAHSGHNLARYLFGFNNDTTCDIIESLFHCRHIYNFNATRQHLPCLAHMVNLAVTDVMSVITCITNIETTTAIWEFDPLLPNNRILGDSLDVVAAVLLSSNISLQIQSSGQCIEYFETLQVKCGILIPLKIPLHSNV